MSREVYPGVTESEKSAHVEVERFELTNVCELIVFAGTNSKWI